MTDPLNDPRFPDRPTHPDFWRLSEVVLQLDANADDLAAILDAEIDRESLAYFIGQRVQTTLQVLGFKLPPPEIIAVVSASFIDAFLIGVRYQQRKQGGSPA